TMSLLRGLLGRSTPRRLKTSSLLSPSEGYAPPSQDTLAAIAELSQMVKDNPDAIEIYLALGNLYRSQGQIDRAIQIRHNLIVRPGLDSKFKAQALYELGLDYRRGGFLDRAQSAFAQARELIGDDPALLGELAGIAAAGREFELAADYYQCLGRPLAQAHYLVQAARQSAANRERKKCEQYLSRALRIYPGSIEAWLERMILAYKDYDWDQLAGQFRKGSAKVPVHLRFILLEGLIQHLLQERTNQEIFAPVIHEEACRNLLKILEKDTTDILLTYYGAWLQLQIEQKEKAKQWLQTCINMDSDFWPARLELLFLSAEEHELGREFKTQLEFFLRRARQIKKFICTSCGLRREQLFFVCPRCQSWHSISFLKVLTN
ncbi:MAG: tetratricopeptide repeat protein, partial [Desulfohalobiaceae bacterium]